MNRQVASAYVDTALVDVVACDPHVPGQSEVRVYELLGAAGTAPAKHLLRSLMVLFGELPLNFL